jgi:hypothetical protein
VGYQVVKQPDGRLSVWSTHIDGLVVWDATPDEVVGWFADAAAARERATAARIVDAVLTGDRNPYGRTILDGIPYAQIVEGHVQRHGPLPD